MKLIKAFNEHEIFRFMLFVYDRVKRTKAGLQTAEMKTEVGYLKICSVCTSSCGGYTLHKRGVVWGVCLPTLCLHFQNNIDLLCFRTRSSSVCTAHTHWIRTWHCFLNTLYPKQCLFQLLEYSYIFYFLILHFLMAAICILHRVSIFSTPGSMKTVFSSAWG